MRGSYVLGLFLVLAGCNGTQRYVGSETGGLFELAMTEATPAFLESEDGNIFIIELPIAIPYREPTEAELAMMANPSVDTTPFASMPFIQRHDIEVQVDWTLSNVDPVENAPTQATVTVNGINEFNEYVPGVRIVDDELVIDFAQNERVVNIAPGERVSWTVRQEPMDEVAVDLASVVNGAPNANQVVYFENQSAHDARSAQYVPGVVPGLMGVRMGIRVVTDSATAPRLVLETALRIRDNRRVLAPVGSMPWQAPAPAPFTPIPPPMP